MFYRLNPPYMLRGWKGLPWILVKRPENRVQPLSKDTFQALLLCDGVTELSDPMSGDLVRILQKCERDGLIESCFSPQALEPVQYYQYYDNRFVQSIFWSVTGRCNYRCRHCFMDAPDAALGELSSQEAFDLIDQMAECGVLRVDLTGGEPFVRKDFWQLVDRILSHEMVIGKIYTNGWLLNEKTMEEFDRRNMKPDISISFDGVGWHDWMRGVPGAETAAFRALRLCQERGLKTDVEMCIHRGNLHTLPQTVLRLRSVGVQNIKVGNVAQTELWRCRSEGNALTNQEYLEAMLPYIDWYYEAGQPVEQLTLANVIVLRKDQPYQVICDFHDGTEKCLDHYLCGAIRMSSYVTPEGRLLPCMPMTSCPEQNNFPKVQEIGLKRGLTDSLYMQFVNSRIKDLLAANPECNACEYRYRCGGGCRATALMEGDHNLMGCDRIMCLLWKGGYYQRIEKAAQEAFSRWADHSAQVPNDAKA